MTGRTFLTSDHHFGHINILDFCNRPFDDVDHMNRAMVEAWNSVVEPGDRVWYLGDFAMGRVDDSLKFAGLLHGSKILVPGNHDRCWKGRAAGKTRLDWERRYLDAGFDAIIHHPRPLTVDDVEIHMCHFPFDIGAYDDRFSGNRPDDVGQFLAHGHVHDSWLKRDRQINVGVDVHEFKPVSVERLREMFLT